ncbi:putative reverse transcriptase domain-containing protein, partial [Tanacetum coccineum]
MRVLSRLEIDECFAYADALRDRGIDARVVVKAVDREESETGTRGPVEVRVERVTHPVMPKNTPEPIQEEALEVTYETLGDLVQRFHDHTEAIPIHRIQVIKGVQREQRCRIVGVESAVTVLTERVAELERDNMRLKGTVSVESNRGNGNRDNEGNGNGGNGGNGNGGNRENGNGNRNANHGMNCGGFMPVARECTFQDFLKCKPHNFSGTEGVVGLTRWIEKMEIWNSFKRTIGVDATYAMKWDGLMKLMTEVYYPRNEIQKMETELWNLTVKGNDLTAYTQRFQELILLCTRMVPDEKDKVERFIGGLPDNIQGNVIAAEPTKLQDAIRIANNLVDQKLKGYARSAENKRRPRHFRKDCYELRNQFHRNQTRNKNGNKTGNQTRGNEATSKAYAIGGGGTNPDSNVVTGTFLLNNCYASVLFDSGADRSFVSSTFSALLDVAPSTLDTSYAVELADGRISET